MRKKLLALLLAAALALGLLAGCGGGKSQSLSQMLLNLLDGQYQNVSVEIDSDLETKLRQAISESETDEELRAALEQLLGGRISFQRLGSGQQGDTAWTLIIYPGTDPDAAARSVYLDLDKVFAALPDDGVYSSGFAMAEMENGYAILVRATVDKAGTEDKPDPVTLESIKVTKEPDREYWAGQPFNPDGMEITATYSNGTTKTLKDIKQNGDQGVKWTPDGALTTVGTQDITITYGEKTTAVTVTVKEPEVDELKVEPSSLTYTAGDYFKPADIKEVTAIYSENIKTETITSGYTITDENQKTVDESYQFTTAGNYTLTVSYKGGTGTVNIEVNPATLTGIEVTTLPTRTTYIAGESFDPAGMIVSEVYSNGTKTAVNDYKCSPDPLTKDNTKVTITYGELETTVEVTVLDTADSYQNGTYSIATAEGLQAWNQAALNDLSINCTLTGNITLTGEWTPIGTYDNPYTGTFDGGNHTITGLKIDQSGTDNVGLIGYLGSGGKVQDVTLTEVNVTGGTYVGGIAGQNDGTVENCSVNGTVTGRGFNDTGGIVGTNYGTISGCSAEGTVTGNTNVGGISGLCVPNYDTGTSSLIGSTIEGCHSTAAVSGISSVGGVVGNLGNNCSLIACYSTGNVTATITDGYAHVGGVVGISAQGTVTACYHATGKITSSVEDRIGGIAGCNDKSIFTACYWENNQEQGTGSGSSSGITEVDGVTTNWTDATKAMNDACGGQYKNTGTGAPQLTWE